MKLKMQLSQRVPQAAVALSEVGRFDWWMADKLSLSVR